MPIIWCTDATIYTFVILFLKQTIVSVLFLIFYLNELHQFRSIDLQELLCNWKFCCNAREYACLQALLIRGARLQSVSLYFRSFEVPFLSIILTVCRNVERFAQVDIKSRSCRIMLSGYFRESCYQRFPLGINSSNSIHLSTRNFNTCRDI